MKHVVSVSLGSSKRDHAVEIDVLGEHFIVERRGTDGDMDKAIAMIKSLDGKVDAFGMGGIDVYLRAGDHKFIIRESKKIYRAANLTPMVDGTGLKNTLERRAVHYMARNNVMNLKGAKALVVCAIDRYGMAEALIQEGADTTFGDVMFALGMPIPIHKLATLRRVARVVAPVMVQLPFKVLYPTGDKQEGATNSRYDRFYEAADVIAGDYHFIRKYLPERIAGKVILTNTVTPADVQLLKDRGARMLITTTPDLQGRSFGTNVMEALLIALTGSKHELSDEEYDQLLDKVGFVPRVEQLNA
jgi:hypothetical protein